MNFYLLTTVLLLTSGSLNAQITNSVGVNTSTPTATLDVESSSTNTTTVEGLLAPRLTKDQLAFKMNQNTAYHLDPNLVGDMLYITDAIAGTNTPESPAMDYITAAGYYYWDGTYWQRYATPNNVGWLIGGNIGLNGGVLGTTNNQPIDIIANTPANTGGIDVAADGTIDIGTTATTGHSAINLSSDGQTITLYNNQTMAFQQMFLQSVWMQQELFTHLEN